jgi:hypothetical protein
MEITARDIERLKRTSADILGDVLQSGPPVKIMGWTGT